MKKLILALALLASIPAFAQHHHHHHGYWRQHNHGGWNWVVPAVIGGVVVYEATRPPVVVQQPVIVQSQNLPPVQQCSPWTEIQNPDGTITRTRTCPQ
jgi:hypothetical protein